MKKLSEVCKLLGVTRKTLRGYDEIGLLHPTDKTQSDYWLYDEKAIRILMAIQIFVEAGYTRKEIKDIFESSEMGFSDVIKQLETRLNDKKKQIEEMQKRTEAMLNLLDFFEKVNKEIPFDVLPTLNDTAIVLNASDEKSFIELLEQILNSIGGIYE